MHSICGEKDEDDSGNACYCKANPGMKTCYPPDWDWDASTQQASDLLLTTTAPAGPSLDAAATGNNPPNGGSLQNPPSPPSTQQASDLCSTTTTPAGLSRNAAVATGFPSLLLSSQNAVHTTAGRSTERGSLVAEKMPHISLRRQLAPRNLSLLLVYLGACVSVPLQIIINLRMLFSPHNTV